MAYGNQRPRILRIITTLVLTILAGGLSILAVLSYQSTFGSTDPATCLADHCFCEAPSLSGLVQPVNTISSLAFVAVGIWILLTRSEFNKKTKERGLALAFGIAIVYAGLASFFYHGTLSFLGQFLDVFSMYVFAILFFIGALIRRNQIKLSKAIILFIILNIIFGLLQYYVPDSRRLVFGLLLIPGLLLEQQPRTTGFGWFSKQVRYFYIGVGLLTAAYIFWILDDSNTFCVPSSLLQGHAIWHILTAIGTYMVILHYKHTTHSIKKLESRK
ncbi:MAG: hypothetical protein JWN26_807 [Candidatus Saccharibacteria bacterium]|nr:hypothetical protein [Candidatus Saccharibacteria bacterium]